MNKEKTLTLALLAFVVMVSGCSHDTGEKDRPSAKLMATVSQEPVRSDSLGKITLNAKNLGEKDSFYTTLRPVGDSKKAIQVLYSNRTPTNRISLGTAVRNGTTGQKFARIEKELNLNATAVLNVQLFRRGNSSPLDSENLSIRILQE